MDGCYLNNLGGCSLVEVADTLGGLATFAAAIIAVLAVIYARKQISEGRAFQFEVAATSLYHEFLYRRLNEQVWTWRVPTQDTGESLINFSQRLRDYSCKFDAWNQYVRAVTFSTGHYSNLIGRLKLAKPDSDYLTELMAFSVEELNSCTEMLRAIHGAMETVKKQVGPAHA